MHVSGITDMDAYDMDNDGNIDIVGVNGAANASEILMGQGKRSVHFKR